jgi:hypothetical protein
MEKVSGIGIWPNVKRREPQFDRMEAEVGRGARGERVHRTY